MERTGCGSLAVAVGNAHGAYVQTPNLDFGRIAALPALPIPLVLHGCSDIPHPSSCRRRAAGDEQVQHRHRVLPGLLRQRGSRWPGEAKGTCSG